MSKGDRVRLRQNCRHPEFRGLEGVYRRYIKSRNVVEVKCDNGRFYDADPSNVEPLPSGHVA